MPTIFNSPMLTLLQSGPKTPEQQVQRVTSPLQQSLNGRQRISLPDFTAQPVQIKPIISARDATGTAQSVQHNTHTDQIPTNIDERLKRNRQILGDVMETAIDFTPVIGDIKGLTWDPIKAGIEGGFGAGLSMAGLGLIGLIPGVGDVAKKAGKKISKLQLPSFQKDVNTSFYDTKFVKQDKEIKNETSLMAERARNGEVKRIGLNVNGDELADNIQNYEPDIRTTYDINGNRNSYQQAEYQWGHEPNEYFQTKEPEHLYIMDDQTTLGEMNTGIDGNKTLKQTLNKSQIRQILDHELGHLIDKKYRPEFLDNSTKLFMDQHSYLSNASELAQRVGQIKSALGITDGSKTFTGQELEQMFKDYLTNPNNIDNAISDTYKRIQSGRWDYFADWVNKNVLSFSPLIILPTTIKNNENE